MLISLGTIACGYPTSLAYKVAEIGAGPGFSSATSVVAAWAADPPHAKFLFHAQAKTAGLGVYGTCYFVLFDCCV